MSTTEQKELTDAIVEKAMKRIRDRKPVSTTETNTRDLVEEAREFAFSANDADPIGLTGKGLLRALADEVERLRSENEGVIDECGHWRAVAEHYAERPLEDFDQ